MFFHSLPGIEPFFLNLFALIVELTTYLAILVFDLAQGLFLTVDPMRLQRCPLLLERIYALVLTAYRILARDNFDLVGVVLDLATFAAFVYQEVFVQLIHHVQPEEVLNSSADQCGRFLLRGISFDLFPVKQKQVGDVSREKFFNLCRPVIRQRWFQHPVSQNFKLLLAALAIVLP